MHVAITLVAALALIAPVEFGLLLWKIFMEIVQMLAFISPILVVVIPRYAFAKDKDIEEFKSKVKNAEGKKGIKVSFPHKKAAPMSTIYDIGEELATYKEQQQYSPIWNDLMEGRGREDKLGLKECKNPIEDLRMPSLTILDLYEHAASLVADDERADNYSTSPSELSSCNSQTDASVEWSTDSDSALTAANSNSSWRGFKGAFVSCFSSGSSSD